MISVNELPYLTRDIPGIGGRIKTLPEDFQVDEVPLYEPAGDGTHVYFRIRKAGLTTMQAIGQIAKALGRAVRDIGYAGLKDAGAVTTQMLSIEHIDPARVQELQVPRVEVLSVSRHRNKLKLGHLAGNRFTIRVRETDVARVDDVRSMLELLGRRGVPNYFGPQRFGIRGDTWEIGRALVRGDDVEAVSLVLGRAGPHDYGEVRKARELFDRGEYEKAANIWPYPFYNEKRICWAVAKSGGNLARAMRQVDPQMKRFYVSAYQSQLFNQVVAERLDSIDRLLEGDLAWRHPQGAVFRVEDVAREQPRCDTFEISPTGPLFGYRMTEPTGAPAELESRVLSAEGMGPADWRDGTRLKVKGARRPLRFRPHDAQVDAGRDEHGDFIEVRFQLESGCYATTVLREICKSDLQEGDAGGGED
jgi:tRNA pseudouridine13 synthase